MLSGKLRINSSSVGRPAKLGSSTSSCQPCRQLHVASAFEPNSPADFAPPPPPSPPPPPPPRNSDVGRRGLLTIVGAASTGALIGYLAGRSKGTDPNVDPSELKELLEMRSQAHFRRDFDGHVWVQGQDGRWSEIRLDPKVPSTVLLRSPDGYVSTMTLGLQQIDLSNDNVMAAIFGNGDWEENITPLQGTDDNGQLVFAQMDSDTFRDMISIME